VGAFAPPSDAALVERCRVAGLKVTPQRVAIYRALVATDAHPTPEDVFHAVRDAVPGLSLGTVYKTLDALEAAGLVAQVALPNQAKRYDGNRAPHHHLICTVCHRIVDFTDPAFDALAPSSPIGGFVAERVEVRVRGRCGACDEGSPEENHG